MITVIGYGSLLSPESAKETVPDLQNFRLVKVPGYRRMFNKVGISFIYRYNLAESDVHIASCSTRLDPDCELTACAFEVSDEHFLDLYEREHRFQWALVKAFQDNGDAVVGRMCTESSDEQYRLNKCITDKVYHDYVGQYYAGKIWREDILPFPVYLNHCLEAAKQHGDDVYQNFVNTTYIADGETTIKDLLAQQPNYLATDLAYTYKKQ
ncbi:MAG: hypothetical protein MI867_09890 [Pseudomonadales bacterium]|nr:hypothetical protein [Pseudomonadales bacterium]